MEVWSAANENPRTSTPARRGWVIAFLACLAWAGVILIGLGVLFVLGLIGG
jgi:hypothetical protein